MSFFERPILNSPYFMPQKHWDLDKEGRPTDAVIESRRRSDLISAMPQAKARRRKRKVNSISALKVLEHKMSVTT